MKALLPLCLVLLFASCERHSDADRSAAVNRLISASIEVETKRYKADKTTATPADGEDYRGAKAELEAALASAHEVGVSEADVKSAKEHGKAAGKGIVDDARDLDMKLQAIDDEAAARRRTR